jgi:hypothetical protein
MRKHTKAEFSVLTIRITINPIQIQVQLMGKANPTTVIATFTIRVRELIQRELFCLKTCTDRDVILESVL